MCCAGVFVSRLLVDPLHAIKGIPPPPKKREAGRWVGTLYLLCLALEKRGERVSGGIRYNVHTPTHLPASLFFLGGGSL